MNNKKIKISFIGCGRVAEHYKFIFNTIDYKDYEIVGCFDKDKKKSEIFANFFKVKSYNNFENMLNDSKQDLLIVLTPSGSHYEISKQALMNNINVLFILFCYFLSG